MARKPRDYKAEYRQRIQRGMARGMTRSQAAGHPKSGEMPASQFPLSKFRNPFSSMKDVINDIFRSFDDIFGPIPESVKQHQRNELEYNFDQYVYGAHPLPAWSMGNESSPPNLADVREMMGIVKVHRFQPSYLVVICGYTEEVYPGHDSEEGCLSYRIPRQEIDKGLSKATDMPDLVNKIIGSSREEVWVSVTKFKIVDKD